jgi:hypothetical protein
MGHLIAIDPSGNFSAKEGKGTTGWATFDRDGDITDFGDIRAGDWSTAEMYWDAVILKSAKYETIVCESFQLQPGRAMAQSWSDMETPQMIGALRYMASVNGTPFILQPPSIKTRFKDDILTHMGIVSTSTGKTYMCLERRTNEHQRDAMRHGLHYFKYGRKKNG